MRNKFIYQKQVSTINRTLTLNVTQGLKIMKTVFKYINAEYDGSKLDGIMKEIEQIEEEERLAKLKLESEEQED